MITLTKKKAVPPIDVLDQFYYANSQALVMMGAYPTKEQDVLDTLWQSLVQNPQLHFPEVQTTTVEARKWRIVSAVQKAIRRGDEVVARRTANALRLLDDSYFWRRLVVIALEEIAVADPFICAWVLAATTSKKYRQQLGEKNLALFLVTLMARAVKDRTVCDLLCLTAYTKPPEYVGDISTFPYLEEAYLPLRDSQGRGGVVSKTLATLLLSGTSRTPSDFLPRTEHPREEFTSWVEAQKVPFVFQYLALRGRMTERYGLWVPVLPAYEYLLQSDWFEAVREDGPPCPLIQGINASAFDKHSLEGKKAISYFSQSCKPIRDWFEARPKLNRNKVVGSAVFVVEGTHLNPRLDFKGARQIYRWGINSDFAGAGFVGDSQEVVDLIRDNLEHLHHARRVVLGLV